MAILTDTKARHIKPETKPIAHGGIPGLTLHPGSRIGHGKWVLRYVSPVTGKRRNMGLGTYPEISIAEVAKIAATHRKDLTLGTDPLEKKQANKLWGKSKIPGFEEAARQVHQTLAPSWKNQKHQNQWINTLIEYVFPKIGEIQIDKITPVQIASVLEPIWLTIPETSSRIKQRIHVVIDWAWAHGYCSSNPVDVVSHLLPQQPSKSIRQEHQPAMPWRLIPGFVTKYMRSDNIDVTRSILEFLILTACRSGEVRGMTWGEVDWESAIWIIPAARMKSEVSHRVPLSPRAIEILNGQKGMHHHWVFPSPRDQVQLSDMAITSFLRRIKAPSSDPLRVATAHGFRSSFRDWASENGYARDLAERALAHSITNQVEAAYHRTDLLDQRRPMMEHWASYICNTRYL